MQLCPTAATTLRGDPCLPSRACKYLSGLTGSACRAWGEAASALHATALLQVHQAKALKDLHKGGHDLAVLHELRAATDLVLRATKVTALVVQERHLWLCLADMKEQEKVQFLGAPVSQTGLFGDTVESFAQQFSAAQKQTEAIKHIMCRRKPAASTLAAVPQPARRRGRPSAAAPAQPQQPSTRQRRGAGRRQDTQPVQAPAKHGGKRKCKRPWDGRPKMLTQKRIFGCVRPLDWFAAIDLKDVYFHVSILPWHRPFLRFTFEGRAYQYKVLPYRLFLSPRVFTKVTEAALVPLRERGVRILNYPRRLVHTCTVSRAVVRTQGPGAQAPQPVGPSGQLGKEQTRANAEDLFSRHGVGFGQPDSMPHPGTCSVGAELPQDFIRQDGGPTEILSEAPGAYGCSCGHRSSRSAPYETASALAPRPNPEVGVETRYSPGSDYTGLPQNLQPVVRSLVPSGRSAPGAGIQACCGIHGCLGQRLGSHVQRARSVRGLDGSPTALAYQLPRAAGSTPCLESPLRVPSGQGRSGPYGQHCDCCVYQPARRFTLPSHVTTHPPPPPLESEASEVPSCHPHPRSVQSGSRRAVSSSTSRGVETPSPGGSADLGTVRSCSGGPVCISRNHPLPTPTPGG